MEVSAMKSNVGMSWKWVKIKDICFIHGGNPSPKEEEFASEGIPFIKMKDLGKYHHTTSLEVVENRIPLELFNSRKFKVIKKGSVIIPRSGSVGLNHRGILAFDSVIVSHICALEIIDEKLVFNKFLYYYLTTIDMVKITKQTTGLDAITFEDLAQIQIPLPPLSTQKRIAEILDAADALRRKDQELIKKYDELAQAIFIDMFGDPVKNEKGWEIHPVIKYCECVVPGRDKPKSFTGNIPWVTTDDLNHLSKTSISKKSIGLSKSEIELVRAKIIQKNSVIMTCVGDLGVVTINSQEIVINQQLHAFQCGSNLNPVFLMYNLSYQKDYMYKMSSSTTVPYMNKTVCNSIPVLCPPKDLQNQFEAKINLISEQLSFNSTIKSGELFNTLIQKAFKGELVS